MKPWLPLLVVLLCLVPGVAYADACPDPPEYRNPLRHPLVEKLLEERKKREEAEKENDVPPSEVAFSLVMLSLGVVALLGRNGARKEVRA